MERTAVARIETAAQAVADADALLIGAGAGIGVDSGLPDFRGNEGFWRAYPPMAERGISFIEMANPAWFVRDPELAWGFYGHRMHLYRDTEPHPGFHILRGWGERMKHGCFVFTSNVDGQFQKAGFDPDAVAEAHGSIHHLQCTGGCRDSVWPADDVQVALDEAAFRAEPPLPSCPDCGALARPNVLMFGDWQWLPHRSSRQEARLRDWLDTLPAAGTVIVELGAGGAVPTVRMTCEQLAQRLGATLIRINPREPHVPPNGIGIAAGALETLGKIDELVRS